MSVNLAAESSHVNTAKVEAAIVGILNVLKTSIEILIRSHWQCGWRSLWGRRGRSWHLGPLLVVFFFLKPLTENEHETHVKRAGNNQLEARDGRREERGLH